MIPASSLRVRIVCGFRQDQEYSIPAEEAHKAYYLFLNKDKRGLFSTGLGLEGADIRRIVPDYNHALGVSPSHQLDGYDHAEMRRLGVRESFDSVLSSASSVAVRASSDQSLLSLGLSEASSVIGISGPNA